MATKKHRAQQRAPKHSSAPKTSARTARAKKPSGNNAIATFLARLEGTPLALEITGLIFVVLAGILFLALVSFSPSDSLLTSDTLSPVVKNLAGSLGAAVASGAYLAFGFASFGFVILIGWLGVHFISHNKPKSALAASVSSLAGMTVIAALFDRFFSSTNAVYRGGAVGSAISSVSANVLGTAGSYFFIFIALIGIAIFVFKFSLKEQFEKTFALLKTAFAAFKTGLDYRREAKRNAAPPAPVKSPANPAPQPKRTRAKKVVDSIGEPPIVDKRIVGALGSRAFPLIEKVRVRERVIREKNAPVFASAKKEGAPIVIQKVVPDGVANVQKMTLEPFDFSDIARESNRANFLGHAGVKASNDTVLDDGSSYPEEPLLPSATAIRARAFPIHGVNPKDFGLLTPEEARQLEQTATIRRMAEYETQSEITFISDIPVDAAHSAQQLTEEEIEDALFAGEIDGEEDDDVRDAQLNMEESVLETKKEPDARAFENEHSEMNKRVDEFNKTKPLVAYPSFIQTNYDPNHVDKKYKGFKLDLLKKSIPINDDSALDAIRETAGRLESTLSDFNIEARVVGVSKGPVITRYELEIAAGTRVSKVVGLTDNIALALASESVRIIAPIPGRSVIGIEIPNKVRNMVFLRDVLESEDFKNGTADIPFALGKGIYGNNMVADLAAAPHLLIAGTTGSGKSVSLSTIILSILYTFRPDELKFIFIDKKRVELSIYNGIPHLMAPVVSDDKKATLVLRHVVDIMEKRYEKMEKFYVRHVKAYNEKVRDLMKKGKADFEGEALELFPYIVVVIDELHNLMAVASKEVEDLISRLAAMSRAVGIHLIIATQRPSADVVTGVIKANLPTRLSFQVPNKMNSRIIIDAGGAEQLLGKGDSLFCSTASQIPERVQGAFVSDAEVKRVVDEISSQMIPLYDETVIEMLERDDIDDMEDEYAEAAINDDLWNDAMRVVITTKKASASFLQRRLKIGYNRAARIIEIMEQRGIIGPENGSKPREVFAVGDQNA